MENPAITASSQYDKPLTGILNKYDKERFNPEASDIKHLRIINALRDLNKAILRISNIDSIIRTGNPDEVEMEKNAVPPPSLSLADFLLQTPKDISCMIETLDNIEASLRDQLF